MELKVFNSHDDSGVNGVRCTAGVEIFVQGAGGEYGLADLANASGDLGGHVFVHVVRLAGRSDDGDDAKVERLLVMVIAIGAIKRQRDLGCADGDHARVDDGVRIEHATGIVERTSELEPDIFAGFEMGGIKAGDSGLNSSATRYRDVGHRGA